MASDGGNSPPRFKSRPHDISFVEGQPGTFSIARDALEDPDSDPIGLHWTIEPQGGGAIPAWLIVDATTYTISGTPPPGSPDYVVTVSPSDGQVIGAAERFMLFTPAGSSGNRSPLASGSLAELQWTEGTPGTSVLAAGAFSDPDGDALALAARLASGAALPSWLTFNAATRTLSGTPPAGADDLTLRFTASDPAGATAFLDQTLRTPGAGGGPVSGTEGGDSLTGTAAADRINGLGGDDSIDAGDGDDVIEGGAGSDRITGGAGSDTTLYAGVRGDYLVSRNSDGVVKVSDRSGVTDTLREVETLQFGSEKLAVGTIGYAPVVTPLGTTTATAVHRFYNVRDKAYFYTDSAAEKDLVLRESTDPGYTPENGLWPYFYQGATFAEAAGTGTLPVYRFYNTSTGHHFFTVSEAERDLVRKESSDPAFTPENGLWPFVDEGVGFHAARAGGQTGTVAVQRFYSPTLNRHFFTANADEAQQLRLTGQWTDEGVGFYAADLGTPGSSGDVAGDSSSTAALTIGRPLVGEVETANDRDWYRVSLTAGAQYTFELQGKHADNGTLVDPAIHGIYGSSGSKYSGTQNNDLGSKNKDALVSFKAPVSGTYFVSVGAQDTGVGTYRLTALMPETSDFPGDSTSPAKVPPGGYALGQVDREGDRDWYRVTLVAGLSYTIDLEGSYTGRGTLADPSLTLWAWNGSKWQGALSNDNIGSKNSNARITYVAGQSGDYFISASGSGAATGTYRLSVGEGTEAAADALGTTAFTIESLDVGLTGLPDDTGTLGFWPGPS